MGSRFGEWEHRHHGRLRCPSGHNIGLLDACKNTQIHRVSVSWYCSCKNAHRRGPEGLSPGGLWARLAGVLAHGGDHTGRVVRSEGQAGRRVHRRGRGEHVAGVAEGRDVTERRHVSGEGGGVERAALGEVLQRIVHLFALFGFARHFSVSGLDPFLLHSQGSVNLNRDQFFFFFYFFFWLALREGRLPHPGTGSSDHPRSGICFQGPHFSPHPLTPSQRPQSSASEGSAMGGRVSASINFRNLEAPGKVFQAGLIRFVHLHQSLGGKLVLRNFLSPRTIFLSHPRWLYFSASLKSNNLSSS